MINLNDYKIRVCSKKKWDKEYAQTKLERLELTKNESIDRLMIQKAIDKSSIDASILYCGNQVWSFGKIINDFKKALASAPSSSKFGSGDYSLTDYLYKFFILSCGSIAHYNKFGWIGEYPTKEDLKRFIMRNEFGENILLYQPRWKTDCKRIAAELIRIANQ